MSLEQQDLQQTLASFLESAAENTGWWYRLPKLNYTRKNIDGLHPDDVMPQLGSIFYQKEEAMVPTYQIIFI